MPRYCTDCGRPTTHHIETWTSELISILLPKPRLYKRFNTFFDALFEKMFSVLGLVTMHDDFIDKDLQMRSALFIKELKKRGAHVYAGKGPFGYTNAFRADINNKTVRFESLPVAEHLSKYELSLVDDKQQTKNHLKKGGFPIADGRSFSFLQKHKALSCGEKLGFPLVVKPKGGSVARHVTTNIKNTRALKYAINKAVLYAPTFIVERYVTNAFVHRATVLNFEHVACVRQTPAKVIGDGVSTIAQLVQQKSRFRGKADQRDHTLYKLVIDDTSRTLLREKNYTLETVLPKNELCYLQKDPFLKLGGDLEEVTEQVHKDNVQLFKNIAKHFDIRVVGIDVMVPDITRSWRDQTCAVLELNSIPCIELHQFPSSGTPQNLAKVLADMFFEYYV